MKSKELIDKITDIGKKVNESCTDKTDWFNEDAYNSIMGEFCENISKMIDIFDPTQKENHPENPNSNVSKQLLIENIDSLYEFENAQFLLPKLITALTENRQDVIDEIETILEKG